MASTYSVTQAMAWGITPQWVNATLNKQSGYQTSTKKSTKKNSWGTKTYTTITYNYPTTIDPDGFTLNNWNTYSNSTKGIKSNNTFSERGYGISTNSGAWVINYTTATQNFQVSANSSWQQASQTTGTSITASTTITNNTPTTQTYNVTLSQGVTNTSSSQLSNAWSNSTTLSLGAQISAQYEVMGVEYSSTLTNSNTISGSSTSTQTSSDSQSISRSLSSPIPPGYTYEFVLQINNSKAGFGWTAPYIIETNDVHWTADQSVSYIMGAGQAANFALEYGFSSGALRYLTNNKAYGVFAGTSASNYNSSAQIKSYVVPSSGSTSESKQAAQSNLGVEAVSKSNARLIQGGASSKDQPRPSINGLGFSIKADRASAELIGSNTDDRLFSSEFDGDGKRLEGIQNFAAFEGNDVISSYGTKDNVRFNLSGYKSVTTRDGKDFVTASAPENPVLFNQNVSIDVGIGNDRIRFEDLSRSQQLSSVITLGQGRDIVEINLRDRGQAQFLFTDFQPGKDRLVLNGLESGNLRFEEAPGGQLIGFYNNTKLLQFRSDFLGASSRRYTISESSEKYEVAFLNFGYYSLDKMPQTLTDLFVQFAGQAVTSLDKVVFTSWKQVKQSGDYFKELNRKVVELGAGSGISNEVRDKLIGAGLDLANTSSSIFDWIKGLETQANALGVNLALPSGD